MDNHIRIARLETAVRYLIYLNVLPDRLGVENIKQIDNILEGRLPPSHDFKDALRIARERSGLTQSDLAKRSGLDASAISHFETEKGNYR